MSAEAGGAAGGGGGSGGGGGGAATPSLATGTAGSPLQPRLARAHIAACFRHPDVGAQSLAITKTIKVVELLKRQLRLPDTLESWQRCWTAVDAYLVGHADIDSPQKRFSRHLRTTNFCIDLYEDVAAGRLARAAYLRARGELISPARTDSVQAGRFRMRTHGFHRQNIELQQANGDVLLVQGVTCAAQPQRGYALGRQAVRTLLGRLVKAEVVERDPNHHAAAARGGGGAAGSAGQSPRFARTGQAVVLKFFEKEKFFVEDYAREDPFKEIASLQYMGPLGLFPQVLDVLEDEHTLIKVESDCGMSLFNLSNIEPDRRIPEIWVVNILRQLVSGLHVLHSTGFCHLDISLENTMFHKTTKKAVLIDFGFLTRLPLHPDSGAVTAFPAGVLKPTGKTMACAPELYPTPGVQQQPVDATKVDVFALGSIAFTLATKDKPFDIALPSDPLFARFLAGEAGELLAETVTTNFGPAAAPSRELQAIVKAATDPDPNTRCNVVQLAHLIVQHQKRFPPP